MKKIKLYKGKLSVDVLPTEVGAYEKDGWSKTKEKEVNKDGNK